MFMFDGLDSGGPWVLEDIQRFGEKQLPNRSGRVQSMKTMGESHMHNMELNACIQQFVSLPKQHFKHPSPLLSTNTSMHL